MKLIALLLSTTLSLLAFSENINSFSADFEQKITDEKKSVLSYQGHVWANRKNQALWEYITPITKKVYIQEGRVQIVEDDLEQVIIKKFNQDIDFFELMHHAKKVSKDTYSAHYLDSVYTIKLQNSMIKSISYEDSFANQVTIVFTKQKQNEGLKEEIFNYTIPDYYDVLRE